MKKIFTIVSVALAVSVSAQTNLFKGSDFNNWTDFTNGVTASGYSVNAIATSSPTGGVGGSGALLLGNNTGTSNAYVFTSGADFNIAGAKYITIKVKGTSGGVSFNLGEVGSGKTGVTYNVPAGTTSDVTLTNSGSTNDYKGSINAANWITIKLDLAGVDIVNNKVFSLKIQKGSTNALYVDDIQSDASLAVIDTNKSKTTLVRNTKVNNEISFGEKANVKIYNVSGSLVKSASVEKNTSLNVSSLPKGIYVVTGEVNGQSVSQKIVKE
ncbi:T9SS type A sorting domain-containing protein [Cloacibacterium caeni]|uniref:T9SS type A sorting domain-containing protein n=1 Tax=Cloacibacterium caeni TaxID=2004710 RepID=UPI001BCF97E5|nr:T9SS type A sorting domain-containing protein [Cloacibacterium caeni]